MWDLEAEPPLSQLVEPKAIREFDGIPNVLRGAASVAFSPDGQLLAWTALGEGAGSDMFVVVWDVQRGRERSRVPGEQVMSFSPDGRLLATKPFNASGVVEVTDLVTGRRERQSAPPWAGLPTSPDGGVGQPTSPWEVESGHGLGASITATRTLVLWDTVRGREIGRLDLDVESDAASLAFDSSGRRLAVARTGGRAYLIDVDPESWRRQACSLVARQFTVAERSLYLGATDLPEPCP